MSDHLTEPTITMPLAMYEELKAVADAFDKKIKYYSYNKVGTDHSTVVVIRELNENKVIETLMLDVENRNEVLGKYFKEISELRNKLAERENKTKRWWI